MPHHEALDRRWRLQAQSLTSAQGGPFDLCVARGECVAITGRSGSGKTVLLRLLADLDAHVGEVLLDGRPRSSWPAPGWRRQVVYQAAEPAWWAPTVREHFEAATLARAKALLAPLGLDTGLLDADVLRLSTGERQRMALVRSLVGDAVVLLLDEPTSALDPAASLAVEALLAKQAAAGLSIVFVTHSRDQAQRVADRVLELRDRRLHPA